MTLPRQRTMLGISLMLFGVGLSNLTDHPSARYVAGCIVGFGLALGTLGGNR